MLSLRLNGVIPSAYIIKPLIINWNIVLMYHIRTYVKIQPVYQLINEYKQLGV